MRPKQHQAVISDAAFSTMVGMAAEYNSACVNTLRRSLDGCKHPSCQRNLVAVLLSNRRINIILGEIKDWCLKNESNKGSMDDQMFEICLDIGAYERLPWLAPEMLIFYLLVLGVLASFFIVPFGLNALLGVAKKVVKK
jgi:hypothetical protein